MEDRLEGLNLGLPDYNTNLPLSFNQLLLLIRDVRRSMPSSLGWIVSKDPTVFLVQTSLAMMMTDHPDQVRIL